MLLKKKYQYALRSFIFKQDFDKQRRERMLISLPFFEHLELRGM